MTLAEGSTLAAAFVNGTQISLSQSTQSEVYLRADWKTFFHSRALRSYQLTFEVTLPPAATLEAAMMNRIGWPESLPKGGELVITHGEESVTFADAVPVSCVARGNGLTNHFSVTLEAVNPDIAEELREQYETGELQEFETGSFA